MRTKSVLMIMLAASVFGFASQTEVASQAGPGMELTFTSGTGSLRASIRVTNSQTGKSLSQTVDPFQTAAACAVHAFNTALAVGLKSEGSGLVGVKIYGSGTAVTTSGGCTFTKVDF